MCVYLLTKFQAPSIILTSFRQGVTLPPPLLLKNEPLKSPPRLGLNGFLITKRLLTPADFNPLLFKKQSNNQTKTDFNMKRRCRNRHIN